MIAYCWASGLIQFSTGYAVPEGAILIASARPKMVHNLIYGTARLSRAKKEQWLVPGVPEAKDQKERSKALATYMKWIKSRECFGLAVNTEKQA